MGAGWCTQDRCSIIELHDAHDHDFDKAKGRPTTGTKRGSFGQAPPKKRPTGAERAAALRPKIVREEMRPDGPFAYVHCPECSGGGCGECQETGEMSLYRWHLWKRRC